MNKYRKTESDADNMPIPKKARLTFIGIFVVALFFILLVFPKLPEGFPGSSFFSKFYPHLGLDLQGGTHLVYEADLSELPHDESDSALEGVRDVIERRVNTLGVAEPIVQTTKKGGSSRIIVELAGVQDVNEAINLIGETPLLEFKELIETPDEVLGETDSSELSALEDENQSKRTAAAQIIQRINNGESFNDIAAELSDDIANKNNAGDLGWIKKGIFTPVFDTVIFDELEIGEIVSEPVQTELGYHIIRKDDERISDDGDTEVKSSHILLRTSTLAPDDNFDWANTQLSGKQLKRAQVIFDPQTNQPQVSLIFNKEGADLFEQITERNVGNQVGIFLDGEVLSSPVVQTVISGGEAVITGNFTLPEAKTLTQRLNAGALPVPIDLLSQQTVGASLGSESLAKSLNAAFIGLILVMIFMVGYYFIPGILAVGALLLYALVTIGLFETIPITLTLAGIAGFILSIGMAVDANVLIFERIREELKRGVNYGEAVEEGFRRAWPSIRDSNISSLITCVILYWFGASIIKGFAITLGVGILISMFSAITVTRTFLRLLVERKFAQKLWIFGIRKKIEHEETV